MQGKSVNIALTPFHRASMLVLIILQFIVYLFGLAIFIHYIDPLPFLSYPSLATATSTETHYLKNVALYLLFWIQHVVMATLKYKIGWQQKFKYFVLYDRYIFNITSGLTLWFIVSQLEPSYTYLFTIPESICLPIKVTYLCIFAKAMWQLGGTLFMPWSVREIMSEKLLRYVPYGVQNTQELKTGGVYAYVRNPLQTVNILMVCFGNGTYTTERAIFATIMVVGVVIGVLMEEKRMLRQFKGYQAYMDKVKDRFLPFV